MIIKTVSIVSQLVQRYNLQNTQVLVAKKNNPYSGKINQTSVTDKVLYKSQLGTPVFTNLTFKSVSWVDPITGISTSTKELTFDMVLLTVSQAKKIVKTEIQGRNGTVKEYIGDDDYQISINGIITGGGNYPGGNGHYPVEAVRDLKVLLNAPVTLPVVCDYLLNLDIHNIVVTDYAFAQEPGGYSKQAFTINGISDLPIELQSIY